MRGLVWLLVLFTAAVAASVALEDGGYVVLVVPPWRVEVSLVLTILTLLAVFALGYFAVRLASHALALPTHVRAFRARRHERSGRRALSQALQALFEGRYGQVEKHATQAWESGAEPGLASLIASRAAQRRRDYARRDEWMQRAAARSQSAEPEWRRARLVLQAEQLLEERRFEEARDVLNELHTGGARHISTLQLLLRAEQGLGRWNESVRLARVLEKRGALPVEAVDGIVVRARTAELSRVSHDRSSLAEFWRSLPERERTHPRIAAAAAGAFMQLGDCRSAHRLLEPALEVAWESELVLLYGECRDADALERIQRAEKWLESRPTDPDLLLTLGRLCIQSELWGKAESYLEASLSGQPSRAAHIALAGLLDRLGKTAEANRHYRASADPGLLR
jgi:HemY protein